MKCIPRASFSIAILDDEDFGILTEDPGGMEAFGLFVAIVVAGRSRLQLDRAERVGETDALVFVDRTRHLLSMIHADQRQLDRCLAAFARVAAETNGDPWLYLDENGRLVIRSFFKFNTNTGWGGARGGSGRKSSGNQDAPAAKSSRNQDAARGNQVFQDDSKPNHLDSAVQSSGLHSGTGSGTGAGTGNTPLTPLAGGTGGGGISASLTDQTTTPKVIPAPNAEPRPVPVAPLPARPRSASPAQPELPTPSLVSDDEPFIPPHEDSRPMVRGPGRDSPVAIRLEKWAADFGSDPNMEPYAYWARQKCEGVPARWLYELFKEHVEGRSGPNRPTIMYLGGILRRWTAAGECPLLKKHSNKQGAPPKTRAEEVFVTAPAGYAGRGRPSAN